MRPNLSTSNASSGRAVAVAVRWQPYRTSPTERGKLGCKHHLVVVQCGLPLGIVIWKQVAGAVGFELPRMTGMHIYCSGCKRWIGHVGYGFSEDESLRIAELAMNYFESVIADQATWSVFLLCFLGEKFIYLHEGPDPDPDPAMFF